MQLEWDVSRELEPGQPLFVTFDYRSGWKALAILGAVLLEDGVEIARDDHVGWSGQEEKRITYSFPTPPAGWKPKARYAVRAEVQGVGSRDSTGVVLASRVSPGLGTNDEVRFNSRVPVFAPTDLPGASAWASYPVNSVLPGHRAFSEGLYDEAIRIYRNVPLTPDEGALIRILPEDVARRQALGEVKPEAVHNFCVVWVTEQRIRGKDGSVKVVPDMTPELKAKWRLHYFGVVQKLIEGYSGGKYSASFTYTDTIAAYDEGTDVSNVKPALLDVGDVLFRDADRCDAFVFLTKSASPNLGGPVEHQYVEGIRSGPLRGSMQLSAAAQGATFFHEFFHSLEGTVLHTPAHAFHKGNEHLVPEWPGEHGPAREFDYYRWRFETTLPKIGWQNVGLTRKQVCLPGRDVEALRRVRTFYDGIPVVERAERKRKASEIVAGIERNGTKSVSAMHEALALDPGQAIALARLLEWGAGKESERATWTSRLADLQRVGAVYPVRPGFALAGVWSPDRLRRTSAVELEWDVSASVAAGKPLEVTFDYTGGRHPLSIEWAALLEETREVARDTHAGFSGDPRKDRVTYSLPAPPALREGARYVVRARVRGVDGSDSSGLVLVSP